MGQVVQAERGIEVIALLQLFSRLEASPVQAFGFAVLAAITVEPRQAIQAMEHIGVRNNC